MDAHLTPLWKIGMKWWRMSTKIALLMKHLNWPIEHLDPVQSVPAQSPSEWLHQASSVPPPPVHSHPTLGNPVPMDIDGGQQRNQASLTCSQCHQPRHKVPDCPLNFNIRSMTIEEVEMELAVKRDMAWVAELSLAPEEFTEPEEDFVQDNKWRACLHCPLVIVSKYCQIYMILKWTYQTCKNWKKLLLPLPFLRQLQWLWKYGNQNGKRHCLRAIPFRQPGSLTPLNWKLSLRPQTPRKGNLSTPWWIVEWPGNLSTEIMWKVAGLICRNWLAWFWSIT